MNPIHVKEVDLPPICLCNSPCAWGPNQHPLYQCSRDVGGPTLHTVVPTFSLHAVTQFS